MHAILNYSSKDFTPCDRQLQLFHCSKDRSNLNLQQSQVAHYYLGVITGQIHIEKEHGKYKINHVRETIQETNYVSYFEPTAKSIVPFKRFKFSPSSMMAECHFTKKYFFICFV